MLTRALVLSLVLALTPASSRAQGWRLDAQAGRLRFDGGPDDADFATLTLGIGYDAAPGGFRLAGAVPLAERDPLYGAAAAWQRIRKQSGQLSFGLDLSAQGFVYHDRSPRDPALPLLTDEPSHTGVGLAGELFPFLDVRLGRLTMETRAGVAHYQSDFADVSRRRTLPTADLRVSIAPLHPLALLLESRVHSADERSYVYTGVTARLARGAVDAWASMGHWFVDSARSVPWAAGASVRVHGPFSLSATARRHTIDPLYRAPRRTTWGLGASLRLGTPSQLREPVPDTYVDGRATITMRAADGPDTPRIAGDFNGWQPEPMRRRGRDWVYERSLKPGVYHYAFVAPDGRWFVPASVRGGRRDDGMGGHVAVLIVERQ